MNSELQTVTICHLVHHKTISSTGQWFFYKALMAYLGNNHCVRGRPTDHSSQKRHTSKLLLYVTTRRMEQITRLLQLRQPRQRLSTPSWMPYRRTSGRDLGCAVCTYALRDTPLAVIRQRTLGGSAEYQTRLDKTLHINETMERSRFSDVYGKRVWEGYTFTYA